MSIWDLLYNTIILPIELLIEVVYVLMFRLLHSEGIALVIVSVVVSTFLIPLQKVSDRLQLQEQHKQRSMEHWVRHIKKTFKGDERYMMLSAYYKEQHYHPIYALRGTIPLLIQIPFFIAAYHFISNLQSIAGTGFLTIQNLARPDGLIPIGNTHINLLPVLMTAINILSSILYVKKNHLKMSMPLYVSAVIFLVLLYRSPAGLVLYWTCNNLYSAIKNAITKPEIQNEARALEIDRSSLRIFLPAAMYLAVLIGGVIPVLLISASPAEFIFLQYYEHPLLYVLTTFLPYFGLFVLWGSLIFLSASPRAQKNISCTYAALCVIFTINALFFGKTPGVISPDLRYGRDLSFPVTESILNLVVLLIILICVVFLYIRFRNLFAHALLILLISGIGVAGYYIIQTHRAVASYDFIEEYDPENALTIEPLATLSKNGPNVIVIMLDRAVGGYYPYIFNEKPELQEAFDGFTLYPNTVSYANGTAVGAVSIFGGYEYNPVGMNSRPEVTLLEKQNEALCMMPRLFSGIDYDVTVFDPPYAGFEEIPDLSIYDAYPEIDAYVTMGRYTDEYLLAHTEQYAAVRHRNMVFYSLFRVAPTILKTVIYDKEDYLAADSMINVHADYRKSHPILNRLKEFFTIEEDTEGSFLMMANEVTHGASYLQLPDYEPSFVVDNSDYNTTSRTDARGNTADLTASFDFATYCSNMSAMLSLAEFCDYLRENGLYDNTRIILASDHGTGVKLYPEVTVTNPSSFNALLMVKDFNATGFTISDEFRTVADTPTLALEGLVEDPVNPYTGSSINTTARINAPFQKIFSSGSFDPHQDALYRDLEVLYVHNDIRSWSGPYKE